MLLKACFLGLLTIVSSQSRIDFTGHRLYSIYPNEEAQLVFLQQMLLDQILSGIDVWTPPVLLNQYVNFRVPSHLTSDFEERLKSQSIEFDTETDDLQKWIDEEFKLNPPDDAFAGMQTDFPIDVYHTYEAISAFIDNTANIFPNIASAIEIGTTYEGNPIKGLKIGSPGFNKPVIWIDGGIHAREWISSAVTLYIMDRLIKGYTSEGNEVVRNLVDTFDWYLIPVINVDGYIYTWTSDRMWRKNRIPYGTNLNTNTSCFGVDVNRNFPINFGGEGTIGKHCAEDYPGDYPFSEAESRAIRDNTLALGERLKAYINLHSYSQLIMIPYGYTNKTTPDYSDQMKALATMADVIESTHSHQYEYGSIFSTIYAASGTVIDWVYEACNVKYSITIELRDTGKRGFILPNDQILPTGEELWAAIKELANIIMSQM